MRALTCRILFQDRVSLSAFEHVLAKKFEESLASETVVFDLTQVEWIGHLPSTLLFSWAINLKKNHKPKHISIILPERSHLSPQVHKALIEYGILRLLETYDIDVPYSSSPEPRAGLPLTVIRSREDLWRTVEVSSNHLLSAVEFTESAREVIKDAFEVVIFELAENAFLHAGGSDAHYLVSLAEASGSIYGTRGVMAVFDQGTPYLEINLGDFGPGIEHRLSRHMPKDYEPPYPAPIISGRRHRKYSRAERILAYAFEFSSTSDRAGREARLESLLSNNPHIEDGILPDEVASGLFCVLEVARSRQGQLIIRTPKGILSLDFTSGSSVPVLKGNKELGIKEIGRLIGTHYLLRLPLSIPPAQRPSISTQIELDVRAPLDIDIVTAFRIPNKSQSMANIVNLAISVVDRHLNRKRMINGISVVMPSPIPLPTRAMALFIGVLRSISHGNRTIIWLEPRAIAAAPRNIAAKVKRFRFGGQPIVLGDLLENKFYLPWKSMSTVLNVQSYIQGGKDYSSLDAKLLTVIRRLYTTKLQEDLAVLLRNESVRHSPGPFLIEGKYYTDVFYEVGKALEDPSHIVAFAEWFLLQIINRADEDIPDLLISTSVTINRVLGDIGDLIHRTRGKVPVVIKSPDSASAIWVVNELLPYAGKKAIVVTDVICRGEQIEDFLSIVISSRVNIEGVFVFVDARDDNKMGKPILLHISHSISVPVISVVEEQILPHEQPTVAGANVNEEERVYVIDQKTHAPTLYVRPYKPQLSFFELINDIVPKSGGLYWGHLSSKGKHYEFFLDFPRLFAALRLHIERWIKEQINLVEEISKGKREPWHACVYNPDGSLTWLRDFIPSINQSPTVRFITRFQLDAPAPPLEGEKAAQGRWLVIMPAIASGDTARRCIEFVSRHEPRSIIVLCVTSRMEPQHLSFMMQIPMYRDAQLRLACFLEFPFGAHDPNEGKCPFCTEVAELTSIYARLKEDIGEDSILTRTLAEKISANAPVEIERDDSGIVIHPPPSPGDIGRIRLRALYNAAERDLVARRTLNSLLSENRDEIDCFLKSFIYSDRNNNIFSSYEFERRLYKAKTNVYARVHEIIGEETPPFQVGRVIGSLIHFIPGSFIETATDMISRFANSTRDVEEICIGLLILKTVAPNSGKLLQSLRFENRSRIEELFSQTHRIISHREAPDEKRSADAVLAVCELWSNVTRTNLYTSAIDDLVLRTVDPTMKWNEIQEIIDRALAFWNQEISQAITRVRTSRLWAVLSSDRNDCSGRLAPLERLLAQLARLARLVPNDRNEKSKLVEEVFTFTKEISRLNKEASTHLMHYFVNPVNCTAAQIGNKLIAKDGSELSVSINIDRTVDLVLCDLGELNAICSELILNWRKYGIVSTGRREVQFDLYKDDKYVALKFGDSFGGRFDLKSAGGIGAAKRFCESYGGYLENQGPDSNGRKSLIIKLRVLPVKRKSDTIELNEN
jgi:hypothetical protein